MRLDFHRIPARNARVLLGVLVLVSALVAEPAVSQVRSKQPGGSTPPLERDGSLLPPAPTGRPASRPVRHPAYRYVHPGVEDRSPSGSPSYSPGDVSVKHPVRVHHARTRVYSHGSGLVVNGGFDSDSFRVGFHIGSGITSELAYKFGSRHLGRVSSFCYPYVRYGSSRHSYKYPQRYCVSYPYYGYTYDYYRPLLGYPTAGVDPFVLTGQQFEQDLTSPQPQAAPLTTLEEARRAYKNGDGAEAIKLFRRHLDVAPDDGETGVGGVESEDTEAMRLLSLAFLDEREMTRSIAMMAHAYSTDPALASRPIDPASLPGDRLDMRRRVTDAVAYAHEVKSASAWLMVAVLMQAEGRDGVALKMLERGIDLGLDERVADELAVELSTPAKRKRG